MRAGCKLRQRRRHDARDADARYIRYRDDDERSISVTGRADATARTSANAHAGAITCAVTYAVTLTDPNARAHARADADADSHAKHGEADR